MKKVARTHIHATQAQYAKSALRKLRLASLAPWAVAALSLGSNVAHAATPITAGVFTVQLQANTIAPDCTISASPTGKVFDMSGTSKVALDRTFTAWAGDKNLASTVNGVPLGDWRGVSTINSTVAVTCTTTQKLISFDIVNNTQGALHPREAALKDSGGTQAFTDGKVAGFLLNRTASAGAITINHGFFGANSAPYTNSGNGIDLSLINSKYTSEFTWIPVFTATGTNPLTPSTPAYAGDGRFYAELAVNVNY